MPSDAEEALQAVVSEVADSSSKNPWRPVAEILREHAQTTSSRAIGIQDYTVINRAVGSPGMQHEYGVHGFVVKPGEPPKKPPADLDAVVKRVRDALENEPYIKTAVIIPHSNNYLPSHVLSCGASEGTALAAAYPNATLVLDIVKGIAEGDVVHIGPWSVVVDAIDRASDGSVRVRVDDPSGELRWVFVGDGIAFLDQEAAPSPFAVGRLHHIAPAGDGTYFLILDRYAEIAPTAAGDGAK